MELGIMSLATFIKQHRHLDNAMCQRFLQDLCAGTGAIHDACIIHRDLAPKNTVLCPEGGNFILKICDLGASLRLMPARGCLDTAARAAPDDIRERRCTVPYAAPEVLLGRGASFASDIWSLAIMAWELLSDNPAQIVGPNPCLTESGSLSEEVAHQAFLETTSINFPALLRPAGDEQRRELLDALSLASCDRPPAQDLQRRLAQHAPCTTPSRPTVPTPFRKRARHRF